jgi:pimeloyl-ACP methyl ester carboxylesterase
METGEITLGGFRTRIHTSGAGEPLAVIHGGEFGMLYSLDAWDLAFAELRRGFTTVAFDRLGQGGTDNPPSAADYTFATVLAHSISAIEALCEGPAHIVGHSRGGLVGARLAQCRPDLVRSLIIVDSNSLAPPDPGTPAGFYSDLEARLPDGYRTVEDVSLEPITQSFSAAHVTDEFCERLLDFARLPKTLEAQQVMRSVRLESWEPDVERAREEALADIAERGFDIPVGVVWGLSDPSAPPLLGLRLLERLAPRTPHATLHVLAGAGHYSFRERPREFAALVNLVTRGAGT